MKSKILVLMLGFLLMSSIAFGATYQETKDAGQAQLADKDFAGARATLAEAVTLGTTPYEKYDAGWYICVSFYNEGKWAECRTACVALLKTDMPVENKGMVQNQIASAWSAEKNYTEALKAYDVTIALPSVTAGDKALALMVKAGIYGLTDAEKAITEYLKVAVAKETPGIWKVASYLDMGDLLTKLERVAEAQEMYLKSAIKGGTIAQFQEAIDKIDALTVGTEKYLEYLKKLLLVIPTKAENAEFLGQVKSEIEKLK